MTRLVNHWLISPIFWAKCQLLHGHVFDANCPCRQFLSTWNQEKFARRCIDLLLELRRKSIAGLIYCPAARCRLPDGILGTGTRPSGIRRRFCVRILNYR